jgi:hypothetical protein
MRDTVFTSMYFPPHIFLQHNVAPRTRQTRRALSDREHIEKERLKARREGFRQYEDPGDFLVPDAAAGGIFQRDKDRFACTDAATVQRQTRDAERLRRDQDLERKRLESIAREAAMQQRNDDEIRREEERQARLRSTGLKARRNAPGMPYDLIAMTYQGGPVAESMRVRDEQAMEKATQRAKHLQQRGRSTGFDPISGLPMSTEVIVGLNPRQQAAQAQAALSQGVQLAGAGRQSHHPGHYSGAHPAAGGPQQQQQHLSESGRPMDPRAAASAGGVGDYGAGAAYGAYPHQQHQQQHPPYYNQQQRSGSAGSDSRGYALRQAGGSALAPHQSSQGFQQGFDHFGATQPSNPMQSAPQMQGYPPRAPPMGNSAAPWAR